MTRRSRRELERAIEDLGGDDEDDDVPDITITREHVDSEGETAERERRKLEWNGSEWSDDDGYCDVGKGENETDGR